MKTLKTIIVVIIVLAVSCSLYALLESSLSKTTIANMIVASGVMSLVALFIIGSTSNK